MMSIFTGAIDYFIKGGPCMWPLLLCSFVAIAIGVERYLYFKKAISGTHFAVTFCRMMNDFNIVGAREFAGEAQGEGAKLAVRIQMLKRISATVWNLLFILKQIVF
ncbi:MAG: hypothetical protein ACLT4X_07425 [Phascolarctobacterium sp.]